MPFGERGSQSEIKCRSFARCRFHPHSAATPLDYLLAEGESKPVTVIFLTVQTLKRTKQTALECGIDPRAIVLDREDPLVILPSRRYVNARRSCLVVFDGVSDRMLQDLRQNPEFAGHTWQSVMGNNCAPFRDLLFRREQRMVKYRLHVRLGGMAGCAREIRPASESSRQSIELKLSCSRSVASQ